MSTLLDPITFQSGASLENRFFLAPLTNTQSHPDGTLSEDEFHWLVMRAKGGFAMTMTCAAHVQAIGQGFPGQLGVFSDLHSPGLQRLAKAIKKTDSHAVLQLHHAGMRSPKALIQSKPVCPSANPRTGARALSTDETHLLRDSFIKAAKRSELAGFDGVEIHGAHGYILCQYFSSAINKRKDQYGGSLENRFRILHEIIDGIRAECSPNFSLGVRLSAERFGMKLDEVKEITANLLQSDQLDYVDISMWDCFKLPEDEAFRDKTLLQHFTEIPKGKTKLGGAGNIRTPRQVEEAINAGLDFVLLGRAAMIHHNFPLLYQNNLDFSPFKPPLTRSYLNNEGLSNTFVNYVKQNWPEFIDEE